MRHLEDALAVLQRVLGADKVFHDQKILSRYAVHLGTHHAFKLPDILVLPRDTQDVVTVVNTSRKYKVALISCSGRTSIEGQLVVSPSSTTPVIVLSCEEMTDILEIDPISGHATVQAGLRWQDLNTHLVEQGHRLAFPIDPSPNACFAGMVGVGGSGPNALKRGTMRGEYVLSLQVVLPSGKVIKTRSKARKSAVGWDTTRLFLGSEGTLGIITQLTVRLAPIEQVRTAVSSFQTIEDAALCVNKLISSGIDLLCCELLDTRSMLACNKWLKENDRPTYPDSPFLFLRFSGPLEIIKINSQLAREVISQCKGSELVMKEDEKESEQLWQARKMMFWSQQAMVPNCSIYGTDSCVPVGKLPELIRRANLLIEQTDFWAGFNGHAGDGNLHCSILVPPGGDMIAAKELADKISLIAIQLDGTCSGEHGIGLTKSHLLEKELGTDTVELMQQIKDLIDPLNLFNPGKLLPQRRQLKL